MVEIYYFIVKASDCCSVTTGVYLEVVLLILIVQSAFSVQGLTVETACCNS